MTCWKRIPVIILFAGLLPGCALQKKSGDPLPVSTDIAIHERFIAIDNVCAWPNLTMLEDRTIVASIFNKPTHGRAEGDVECWKSGHGMFWHKVGTPTRHDPGTNRMNVAAGLAGNGDLVVVASGWSLRESPSAKDGHELVSSLRPWISRSTDGGKTWELYRAGFPDHLEGMTAFIPFGDIFIANDGSLRMSAYASSIDRRVNKTWMFRSDDDGYTWRRMSLISDGSDGPTSSTKGHNETALYPVAPEQWIAVCRRWAGDKYKEPMDLLRSGDDGTTWQMVGPLTKVREIPGHVMRLNDGALLLTFGHRVRGSYGVAVKRSSDNGSNWSKTHLLLNDFYGDGGYPSSVQLPDGRIVTAYYTKGVKQHARYHMGVVIWSFK